MNRRTLLKNFGKAALLSVPFFSKWGWSVIEEPDISEPKWVLIYDSMGRDYTELIERARPYLTSQDPEWCRNLALWDIQSDGEKVRAFTQRYGKNTREFSWPILISIPDASESEVETWTIDWLSYIKRLLMKACYPISGGWWSVDGDWNPTVQKVRKHVYQSPNHATGKFQLPWLDLLKYEELQSLHSDHHREMIKQGKVHWKYVNGECPTLYQQQAF